MTLRLSTDGANTYRECPERYRFRKVLRMVPVDEPWSTAFGTLNHLGLNAFYKGESVEAALSTEKDPFTRTLAEAMLAGYQARYSRDKVIGVEVPYELPVTNYIHTGRMDLVVEIDGDLYVQEHKTTQSAIYPGAIYWSKLGLDPQISNYQRACEHKYGRPCKGVIYDVLRIPEERPYKATPVAERKLVMTGQRRGQLYAGQHDRDETVDEYRERLLDAISRDPDSYYQRRAVVRLADEAERAAKDLHHTALQVLQSHELNLWARNPQACGRYKEPCPYLGVCEGRASIKDVSLFRKDNRV